MKKTDARSVPRKIVAQPSRQCKPMPLETDALYTCPSCGEQNALGVDPTAGRRQTLLEDCPVCCRPLVFTVNVDRDGDPSVERVDRE